MADSSLDDFFAKKDKSKKSKKKFTTSDQIARELEETGKKYVEVAVKAEKEKPPITPSIPFSSAQDLEEEDAEWRDFEVEKEKDYSGLKIQNMQIADSREDDYEREKITDNEDGEPQRIRDYTSGPWNKAMATSTNQPQEPQAPSPPPVEVETKDEPKSNVYRPPHARNPQAAVKTKLSNKSAPEITSDFHFPSLSAAADNTKATKKGDKTLDSEKGFESVKRGVRTTEDFTNKGPKLDLGNKYTALTQSDMS
uniref:Protein CDV3 homolog n=1 Tax=Strigamia maritima TaxID=126957 RepID=T1JG35_STRMM